MKRIMLDDLGWVDIYPVGVLADIRNTWMRLVFFGFSREVFGSLIRQSASFVWFQFCRRDFRSIRQYVFNGYLAEPDNWPVDREMDGCGRGWTRGRAVRDLQRRYRNAVPYQDAQG